MAKRVRKERRRCRRRRFSHSIAELRNVVRKLRRECPWDRKQTTETTRPLVLNEAFELDEALRTREPVHVSEELGDYLFMGLFLADVLQRELDIRVEDALAGIVRKLKRRHPHVYGTVKVRGAGDVLRNWERIKRRDRDFLLDGIPSAIPALHQAQLIQERCRRVGFDWKEAAEVLNKVVEEISELRQELHSRRRDRKRIAEEFGDLLFAMANLARHLGIDSEGALKQANAKFTERFRQVEQQFRSAGRDLKDVGLDEMEAVWQLAKRRRPTRRRD